MVRSTDASDTKILFSMNYVIIYNLLLIFVDICLDNRLEMLILNRCYALQKWMIPLKEAASLLWYFYRDPLRSLTLLSLNVLSQKS